MRSDHPPTRRPRPRPRAAAVAAVLRSAEDPRVREWLRLLLTRGERSAAAAPAPRSEGREG